MMAASTFMDTQIVAVDNQTATAMLHYTGTLSSSPTSLTAPTPRNATEVADNFTNSLRSLNTNTFPARISQKIDHSLFFTIGLGINLCPAANGSRVVADINYVTFVMETTALQQTHFFNISGVFTLGFSANPPTPFNYTGTPPASLVTTKGMKPYRLPYN